MTRILKILAIFLVCFYLVAVGFVYLRQSHFLFLPGIPIRITPIDFGAAFEKIDVPCVRGCMQGDNLTGWWLAPPDAAPKPTAADVSSKPDAGAGKSGQVLLYLHGNAGNIGDNAAHVVRLNRLGPGVFIFDYRGYGESHGPFPTEARVDEDAESAWSYLTQQRHIDSSQIIIYGHSLGSGIALDLALHHPEAAGLIMESGYTSVLDMAKRSPFFRWFPLELLLNQRFDSISKVTYLKVPVLFIHGTDDTLIPPEMSRQLYAAAPSPKKLLLIEGGEHDNSAAVGGERYLGPVGEFLRSLATRNPASH